MSDNSIYFESGVGSKKGNPFVNIKWGSSRGQFSPKEIRAHAMGLLEAAAAAKLDACLIAWAIAKMGACKEDAGKLLLLFRQKRVEGKLPSMTLNIDGDPMRPDTIKEAASDMLYMAFVAEAEAFLVDLIVKDVGHSAKIADAMVQEFREMRGDMTMWPSEKGQDE